MRVPNPGQGRVGRLPGGSGGCRDPSCVWHRGCVAFGNGKDTFVGGLAGGIKLAWMQNCVFKIIVYI